jgi:hypothetical protein
MTGINSFQAASLQVGERPLASPAFFVLSPGPSGLLLLDRGAAVSYATGRRGRMPRRLVHCLPAPLEAGAGTGSSTASFRTHSGARMAQDRRKAPVLMAYPCWTGAIGQN